MRKILKSHILSLVFIFIPLGIIFTYPLVFGIKRYIPGFFSTDEVYGILRQFWWYKHAWLNRVSYQQDTMLAVPFGFTYPKILIYPFWEVIGRYLTILTNEIVAYNCIIILSFLLSVIFMYYLVYYLTKDRASSIFSVIIYSFSPYYFVRIWQHFGLSQIQWMPLYILVLLKIRAEKTIKSAFFAAIVFFIIVSFEYQYAYFMFVVTMIFLALEIINGYKDKNLAVPKLLSFSIAIAFLLSMLSAYSFLKDFFNKPPAAASVFNIYRRPFEDLFAQSARPLSYFLPSIVHPVFGKFTEKFIGSALYGTSFTEHTLYLGWTPIFLAFLAFKTWLKNRKDFYLSFFIFMVVGAWFFSQPPWWNIGPIKIYMPSFFMYKVLPMFRAYCRFGVVVMLGVAVLAGFGIKFFLEKFKSAAAKILITILLSGLVLFEFWSYPPFKIVDLFRYPKVYDWLKTVKSDIVIAEYPLDIESTSEFYKFYQTRHGKRMINGSIPGSPANRFMQKLTKVSESNTTVTLKQLGVRYILVHKQLYLNTELIDWIEELKKIPSNSMLKLINQSEGIDVYEVF